MLKYLSNARAKRRFRGLGGKLAAGLECFGKSTTACVEEGVRIGHAKILSRNISIGAHSYIRSGCVVSLVSEIGRYCSIGSNCMLGQQKQTHPLSWVSTHPFQYENTSLNYEPGFSSITIGHDVWVGHEATILEGASIGTGAVIATKAMVTKNVPPYAIVAGNPAKIVGYRHSEAMIERLLRSQWWNFDLEDLKRLPSNDPEMFLDLLGCPSTFPLASYRQLKIKNRNFD